MDVKELIIGGYYSLFQGNKDGSDCIVKVTSVNKYEVGIEGCEEYDTCMPNILFPIDITREMLEKNGFTCDDAYAIVKLDEHSFLEYYYFENRLRKIWKGVDEWQNHSVVRDITFQCNCRYVHELQSAFRLAMVDKEIVP